LTGAKLHRSASRLASSVLLAVFCGLVAGPLGAQTAAEKSQAQALFDEARKLIDEGKTSDACDKFAASQRLDPQMGTQLNLAVCYEKVGKTASAWALFVEIQTTARRAGQNDRADYAKGKAEALVGGLSKLRVQVTERVEGLAISFGGNPLADGAWGSLVPVDPGEQVLEARAPGYKPWTEKVTVGADAAEVEVTVPKLELLPPEPEKDKVVGATPGPAPVVEPADGTVPIVLGWTSLGLAAGAGAAGAVLRVMALGKDSDSDAYCGEAINQPEDSCYQEGQDLRDEAQVLQLGSVIAWIAGGAFVVSGVILLLTAPSDDSADTTDEADEAEEAKVQWNVLAGPDGGGVFVGFRW
jgi:hypothetical protein